MTDLATTGQAPLIAIQQKHDADALSKVSKSGDYLPYIQVGGGNSKVVKSGLLPMAHFGLTHSATDVEDLGKEFDAIVIAWRPKAIDTSGDGNPLSYFNQESPDFAAVMNKANNETDSGCFYGPEFMVYIPGLPRKNKFACFLFGSKSARRETPGVMARMGNMATFKIRLAEQGKYSWHVQFAVPCSTPPANMPDPEELAKEVERFQNPKDSQVELDTAPAGTRER